MKRTEKNQAVNADTAARKRAIARWETEGGKVLPRSPKPGRLANAGSKDNSVAEGSGAVSPNAPKQ